jgi:hypothetical protein
MWWCGATGLGAAWRRGGRRGADGVMETGGTSMAVGADDREAMACVTADSSVESLLFVGATP